MMISRENSNWLSYNKALIHHQQIIMSCCEISKDELINEKL